MRADGPNTIDSVLPVARWNSAASSSSDVFMAVVLSTLISFGTALLQVLWLWTSLED
jgi:hypothetical protein